MMKHLNQSQYRMIINLLLSFAFCFPIDFHLLFRSIYANSEFEYYNSVKNYITISIMCVYVSISISMQNEFIFNYTSISIRSLTSFVCSTLHIFNANFFVVLIVVVYFFHATVHHH